MNRTGWLGLALICVVGIGAFSVLRWPSSDPALDCPPSEVVWDGEDGQRIARCVRPEDPPSLRMQPVPAGQARTLGRKLDLNSASAEDLAGISGIGKRRAAQLVEAREKVGGFQSWDEVDALPGFGARRMDNLREAAELRSKGADNDTVNARPH